MRPDGTGRSFWDRRTVSAGVVLALVVGLLIWLLVTRVSGAHHVGAPTTQRSPASSVATTVKHTTSSGSACHVPTGSQAVPQYSPQGITWQLYQTVALPYSNTAGPMIVDGGVARCYAHDPLGALLAASQNPRQVLDFS